MTSLLYNRFCFTQFFTTAPEGADMNNTRVLSTSVIASEPVTNYAGASAVQMRHHPRGATRPLDAPPSHTAHHHYSRGGQLVTSTQSAHNGSQQAAAHASGPPANTGIYDNLSRKEAPPSYNNGGMSSSYSAISSLPQESQQPTYREARQRIKPQTGFHHQYSQGRCVAAACSSSR